MPGWLTERAGHSARPFAFVSDAAEAVAAQFAAIAVQLAAVAPYLAPVAPEFVPAGAIALVPAQVPAVGAQIPAVAVEVAQVAAEFPVLMQLTVVEQGAFGSGRLGGQRRRHDEAGQEQDGETHGILRRWMVTTVDEGRTAATGSR